ncbi:unnamed protein product [Dovyalis caffra]|uniref:Uncharacterized protein n=1 Tax=Dovyalis caffra TaxID=77055 RepID=A0AAV1QYM3_9ROSI|nr:unnamed protein product [Dovyalis caffra]
MGSQRNNIQYWAIIILFVAIIFVSFSNKTLAARPLDQEADQWLAKNLIFQSLPRGPAVPAEGGPCSQHRPGRGCIGEISGNGDGRSRIQILAISANINE